MAIATINPATGQVLKTFEALSDAQIEVKLQKAADTFLSYRKVPFAERARMMMKAAAILDGEKETFARVMTTEMGKTLRSAVDEAAKCAWVCRYYAENAEKFLADEIVETTASRSYIRYQPLGAVLAVMPWNFPFWQVLRFAAPAFDGRERRASEARVDRSAKRAGDRGHLSEGRLSRRSFPNAAGGFAKSGQNPGRSAGHGGHADGKRRGGNRSGNRRGEKNQESGAGTGRKRSLHRDAEREPGGGRRPRR